MTLDAKHVAERASVQPAASERWRVRLHDGRLQSHPLSKLSRRQFFQHGASVLGAALAVPHIIPASALGLDGHTPPSERIGMGFIGVGGQGRGHLLGGAWTYVAGGYAGRDDVQVLAVCDARRERREEATQKVNENYAAKFGAEKYTACRAYNDFRDVLARDDIDAVLIASPIHWHGVMTVMAAQAGKDIYCEKPTAITIQESQAMVSAVRRYGRIFQAGTQQRSEYGGKFRRACEIVRIGGIGRLKEVYAFRPGGTFAWKHFGRPQPVPDGLDWDLYLGPAPWQPYGGFASAHMFMGVGDINWAPHHYDFIQWALDADRTGPVEIRLEDGVLHYLYANGVIVRGCPAPDGGPGGSGGARFIGTDGWVAVDRDDIAAHPAELLRQPVVVPNIYRSDSHSGNFLDCVRTRRQPICDMETAHRAASAVLLGGIALELQRSLKWNPQKEQFVNDEEANRMLSAAFRPPWVI
ncbi:MAG: Gfo/Idh/MocA family oxidoreductase [Verrucomicrobia bacterium]|nr:Gfo/Idh/MocA family oxidoreductase [Verrucomicrobiota bacterium]